MFLHGSSRHHGKPVFGKVFAKATLARDKSYNRVPRDAVRSRRIIRAISNRPSSVGGNMTLRGRSTKFRPRRLRCGESRPDDAPIATGQKGPRSPSFHDVGGHEPMEQAPHDRVGDAVAIAKTAQDCTREPARGPSDPDRSASARVHRRPTDRPPAGTPRPNRGGRCANEAAAPHRAAERRRSRR